MKHYHEIIPGLFIGDHVISNTQVFYKTKCISCVINCTKELDFLSNKQSNKSNTTNIQNIRIPVDDDLTEGQIELLYKYLWKITGYIHQELSQYKNILVHCYAGRQRSATIVCAYLMRYGKMSYKKAVTIIRSKRQVCFMPSINFKQTLLKFETYLHTILI